jgi:phage terminase large subunit GpA-like protein
VDRGKYHLAGRLCRRARCDANIPVPKQIADCIADPTYERVTVLKAARVGYTSLLVGAIGYWCLEEPGPILCLLPVEADCKDFMTSEKKQHLR